MVIANVPKRIYRSLEFIGSLPRRNNLKDRNPCFTGSSSYLSRLPQSVVQPLKEIADGRYGVVRSTKANTELAISGWDQSPALTFFEGISGRFYKAAWDLFYLEYGFMFFDPISSIEEVVSDIDFTTSPGYPASFFGMNTKRELVDSEGFQEYLGNFDPDSPLYDPIWSCSPKREFMPVEDIVDKNKIRVFCIPPYFFLYFQHMYGKRVSLRLKNFKWSAYGFCPYFGGTDELASQLETKRVRIFYDVSGWDKIIPILSDVYNFVLSIANKDPSVSEWDFSVFMYIARNMSRVRVVLPDGDVVVRTRGNPSGSGTTTRDNIIMHIVMIMHMLFQFYYEKFGETPTDDFISMQVVKVFGDDSIMSLDVEFDGIENFVPKFFLQYGLKIKYVHGGLDFPVTGMEFLGFRFEKREFFYPKYPIARLAAGLVIDLDSVDRESYSMKVFSLMMMSFPHPEHLFFVEFAKAWSTYLNSIASRTPTEKVVCYLIDNFNYDSFYVGLESFCNQVSNFFPDYRRKEVERLCLHQWEELIEPKGSWMN